MPPLIPDRATILDALAHGAAIPVAQPLPASQLAPLHTLVAHLADDHPRWLLESARQHPTAGRYSYSAWSPRDVLRNVSLATLRDCLTMYPVQRVPELPPFIGGAIGYVSYDYRHALEQLPQRAVRDLAIPDTYFTLHDTIIACDHLTDRVSIITLATPDGTPQHGYEAAVRRLAAVTERLGHAVIPEEEVPVGGPEERQDAPCLTTNVDPAQFTRMVRRALDAIKAGDIYQANLSVRWLADTAEDPWRIYERLQRINPSPYAAFADLGDLAIVSCSPELLVRVRGRTVTTRPIAGTRPRGATPDEDLAQSLELILSDKERAEHLMLVDLERNDVGRVCRYGSVVVDQLMTLEDYSHVIHIVSNVRGELRPACDWSDALAALFPGGTITGCPKIRAMAVIDELEPTARGLYTGSIGWVSYTGDADFNIAIRTMIVHEGRAYIQAGAGIVADSQPEREYAEVQAKAQALIEALRPVRPSAAQWVMR